MTDLTDLIARLEAATGPDRKLDAEILVLLENNPNVWAEDDSGYVRYLGCGSVSSQSVKAARYTGSVDAALALVPKGAFVYRINQYTNDRRPLNWWGVRLRWFDDRAELGEFIGEHKGELALAICIAALRAREAG